MPSARETNRGGRGNAVPLERKRATGNPGRGKIPDKADTVALVPLDPDGIPLGLDEQGRDFWTRTVTHAQAWVSRSDYPLVYATAVLTDEVATLHAEIQQARSDGTAYLPNAQGALSAHPAMSAYRDALGKLLANLKALGLTPVDRAKIGVAEVKAASELEKALDRRGKRGA